MSLLFLVITIQFVAGALGIKFLNRKLPVDARKNNWLKYFVYLFIFFAVLASALINKNLLLGFSIIISSASLLELLKLGKLPFIGVNRNRFIFISMAIFSVVIFFFSIFVLLPSPIIAYTYTIVIVFDGASQISGQIAGKKKILPVLSPGKTWAGLIGGIVSALISSIILHDFAEFPVFQSFLFGLLVCVASFLGDMAASAYKRAFNAKDFGKILPGQGGMLDRFDSFLASGAIIGFLSILTFFTVSVVDRNIAAYLGYSIIFMVILLAGELLQHIFRLKAEYSRVFSHILAGVVSLFMIRLFSSPWYIIILCIQSSIFLFLTKKLDVLSSHNKVERNTIGSEIFFFGILAVYLISEITGERGLFILPVAILTISDPVASLSGLNRRSGFWPNLSMDVRSSKTYLGSIGFFVSTFVILLVGLPFFYSFTTWEIVVISLVISFVTTFIEVISSNGTDNILIPVVVSGLLTLLAV